MRNIVIKLYNAKTIWQGYIRSLRVVTYPHVLFRLVRGLILVKGVNEVDHTGVCR